MKNKITTAAIFAAVCIISAVISFLGQWENVFCTLGLRNAPDKGNFVRFVDVGQGDCTLVQSSGKVMLIDTGDKNNAAKLCEYIRSLGFDQIDTVIITHPHSDHLGGLEYLNSQLSVASVYITENPPEDEKDGSVYHSFMDSYGGEKKQVEQMTEFSFGDFTVKPVFCDSDASDENDRSAVIRLECNDVSFLVTGDVSESDKKINTSADVLKVAHHGSKTSTSMELLNRVKPKYAVVSVGADNSFGHPNKVVTDRLHSSEIQMFRTDCNGTVTFDVTDNLKINTEY